MKKIKVAILHNIINPNRIPLFNELSLRRDIDLTVYFLDKMAVDRKWDADLLKDTMNFKYKVLPSIKLKIPFINGLEYNINFGIFKELKKEKFDVVIGNGWVNFADQILPFFKKVFDYKYILWAGSTTDEPSLQRKLTHSLVKIIVRRADSYISYGTKSKNYLISLGANYELITPAYNSGDSDKFIKISKSVIQGKKEIIRKKLGIQTNQKVILYSGQFIDRKNVEILIEAVAKLESDNLFLLIQGYGKLKDKYHNLAKNLNINFRILSYFDSDSMPVIYTISDLFVLPSKEEVWGLVVNEAMACGLPVIVSNKAGCIPDLIQDSVNGYSFNPENIDDLVKKIKLVIGDEKKMKMMGKKSISIIKKKSLENSADAFVQAINHVL